MKWAPTTRSWTFLLRIIFIIRCSGFLCTRPAVVDALEARLTPQFMLKPLIGGPSWLKVHVQVNLVVDDDDTSINNNQIRHTFDFVPLDATNPQTLVRLITLQSVPGQIRTFQSTHPPSLRFCQQYNNKEMHLISNNCWTFACQFYLYSLQQEGREEKESSTDNQ